MSTFNGKVLAAMARDPKIGHREFRYAFVMMQEDGACLTQGEIAEVIGATHKSVERAVKRLKAAGYVTVERPSRHEPNSYLFHLPGAETRSNLA